MPIEIKMPALSPTMEEGTLAKWLVKEGDSVRSGDILAEIETDKATMEFEAVDEGVIASIAVAEGTDGVKVGTVIATLTTEDEDAAPVATRDPAAGEAPQPEPQKDGRADPADPNKTGSEAAPITRTLGDAEDHGLPPAAGEKAAASPAATGAERVKASPLARRIAAQRGVELGSVNGTGPNGRIVRADVEAALPGEGRGPAAEVAAAEVRTSQQPEPGPRSSPEKEGEQAVPPAPKPVAIPDVPHEATKLSNVRKTIARRLTEAKQTVPHIYLTVDVRLDALLTLRAELNAALEARGVKLSVNDLLVKALAAALMQVPKCNVMFTPDQLISFARADISVAVSTPAGLITPVVREADTKTLSVIATEIKALAVLARDGKLKPEQYQGGTASISNMGMYGIKQFDAVINPPQGMILAVGAGEKRPWVMADGTLGVATIMSATGSFDHRAIDGADGAGLMQAFKGLVEKPLGLLA
jgi:pyruvate dehydrogenase E2 component (dihydrolipoamide acetyltransferase)